MEFINGFCYGTLFMANLFLAYVIVTNSKKKDNDSKNEKK